MSPELAPDQYQYVIYLALSAITAPAIAAAAHSAGRKGGGEEAKSLSLFMVAGLGYMLSNALELLFPTEAGSLFFARLTYLFVVASPVLGLRFGLSITGRKRAAASKPLFALLFVIPALTLLFVWAGRGALVWKTISFNRALGLPIVHATYGPWFYVHMTYTYALLLASMVIIIADLAPRSGAYSRQSLWVAAGVVVPIAVSALYAFRVFPAITKDFTPVGCGIAGLAFYIGIKREGLLDIMPVASAALVAGFRDPIIVADRLGRIVGANGACRDLPCLPSNLVGMQALVLESLGMPEGATGHRGEWELALGPLGGPEGPSYHLRSFPLLDIRGRMAGRVFAFHDVTTLSRLLAEKQALIAELTAAAKEIGVLRGIIPICANCKRIRDDQGYWSQVEEYLSIHAGLDFTHGLCPDCLAAHLEKVGREDSGVS